MSFFESRDYPELDRIVVSPEGYKKENLVRSTRDRMIQHVRGKKVSKDMTSFVLKKGKEIDIKILHRDKELGVVTDDTRIDFVNEVYYADGKGFNLRPEQLVNVDGSIDLRQLTKVSDPDSFAKILDRLAGELVLRHTEKDVLICNNYYHKLEN